MCFIHSKTGGWNIIHSDICIYIKQDALQMHAGQHVKWLLKLLGLNKNWNTQTIFLINISNMSENPFSSVEGVTCVQTAWL